jgi:CO dehydrogenase/acetyl-CoA synthase alpha subunit
MSGSRAIGGPGGYFGVPLVLGARTQTQTAVYIGANNSDADDNITETIIDATAADTETISATAEDAMMAMRRTASTPMMRLEMTPTT